MTDIETILPGPAARDGGLEYARAVWSGLLTLEEQAAQLRDGLHDLDIADGIALDIRGDWCGERRLGLGDADYRRIIAGREAALGGGVLPFAVLHAWTQLTQSETVSMESLPGEVQLFALLPVIPGVDWVARAAAVTRDLIPVGREFYATLYTQDSFTWGVHNFNQAGFATGFGG